MPSNPPYLQLHKNNHQRQVEEVRQNKTPCPCMTPPSLSKIYQGYGAMQKENKRCIPKEGMPHAFACQKKEENKRCIPKEGMPHAQACQKKRKRQPLIQKERKREMVHTKEFIHQPPKISTHLHILIRVFDLFLLWIRSLTQQNMKSRYAFKSSIPTAPQKQPLEIGQGM